MNDLELATRYVSTARSAVDRNIEFSLTLSDMRSILRRNVCPYTGSVMTDVINDDNQKTLDRIDASRGYVRGNVIACSKKINSTKGNLTSDQILAMAKVIKRKNKQQ
jgi:hypothetical protein